MNAPFVNERSLLPKAGGREGRCHDQRFGAKRLATLAAAMGLVAELAGTAHAADFCLKHWRGGPGKYFFMVGKGFRVPAKGRCKPFIGVSVSDQAPDIFDFTGSACTASDGSTVHFVLTEMDRAASTVGFVHIMLPLPLGPLGTMLTRYPDGSAAFGKPSPETCPTPTMPVP